MPSASMSCRASSSATQEIGWCTLIGMTPITTGGPQRASAPSEPQQYPQVACQHRCVGTASHGGGGGGQWRGIDRHCRGPLAGQQFEFGQPPGSVRRLGLGGGPRECRQRSGRFRRRHGLCAWRFCSDEAQEFICGAWELSRDMRWHSDLPVRRSSMVASAARAHSAA